MIPLFFRYTEEVPNEKVPNEKVPKTKVPKNQMFRLQKFRTKKFRMTKYSDNQKCRPPKIPNTKNSEPWVGWAGLG